MFSQVPERTFQLMIILIPGFFTDNNHIIEAIHPIFGGSPETFPDTALDPVTDNAVSHLFTDRDAYSAFVILAFIQNVHDEKPVPVRPALLVDLAKITVLFQGNQFFHAEICFLPLALRAASTLRPPLVLILARKPCTFAL